MAKPHKVQSKKKLVDAVPRRSVGTVINPPDDLAIGVGKIIVLWSFEVWLLQQVTYALLDLDDARGRLAVRDPRPEDHVLMIEELMELSGFTTTINLRELRSHLTELKGHRDNIAHSIWLENPDTPGKVTIHLTTGKWDNERPLQQFQGISRRLIPETRNINVSTLEAIRAGIEDAAKRTGRLLREVEEQYAALPKRPPRQSALDHLQVDPNSKTPQPPPSTSQK